MSDDLLEQMARALADEHDGAASAPGATRLRIMQELSRKRMARRKQLVWGIPLGALLMGSTAWAGASGRLPEALQAWVDEVVLQEGESAPQESQARSTRPTRPAVEKDELRVDGPPATEAPTATDEVTAADGPAVSSPARALEDAAAKLDTRRSKASSSAVESSQAARPAPTESPAEEPNPALDLYKQAHRAHFHEGDWATAASRYAEYLAADPDGIFAAEARYNRGACLIRLGRTAEARPLLEAFAQGEFGGYRQEEAKALLEALE